MTFRPKPFLVSRYDTTPTKLMFQGLANIDGDYGFAHLVYRAKNPLKDSSGHPQDVIAVGTNPDEHTIISDMSYAERDLNPSDQRCYSSTLTWNIWQNEAGASPMS